MKVKTSDLIGHALDWAVAKCLEPEDQRLTVIRREDYIGHPIERETEYGSYTYEWWAPSRIWAQGGPIIERENITVTRDGDICDAYKREFLFEEDGRDAYQKGPTMLVAAMRCYVASKLGTEVDVPKELL